ncbi:MAG: bifunctional DNA-formamidopyrimidine glycosylase/DNA-(apurinic or apyrimidinic site) lyase [Hyphomicrobiaceae bacterium]
MPELPEVETVRRGLEPVLVGARLSRVVQRRPNLRFPFPKNFTKTLKGQRIEALNRRAKYLVAELSNDLSLVMHLGMSGRFTIKPAPKSAKTPGSKHTPGTFVHASGANPKHDHVVFETSCGASVTYNDPRRFGFMLLIPNTEREDHKLFCNLGVEPLGNQLSPDYLAERAVGKKVDLKAFLMDQRNVAGLGNIYVAEALFRAGLNPNRQAATLATKSGKPTARAEKLVPAIRNVLDDAIAVGGSSLRDYRQADGALGYFQHTFSVYGKDGEPCQRDGCNGKVRKVTQAGRSTFYCAKCQK